MNTKAYKHLRETLTHVPSKDFNEGMQWYDRANEQTKIYANELEIEPKLFAEITSILSPSTVWEKNLDQAFDLVSKLKTEREEIGKLVFNTYKANVTKAIAVYDGKETLTESKGSGMKTYNFARNLMLDPKAVTIDRQMVKLLDINHFFGTKTLTYKTYYSYAKVLSTLAKELSMIPYQLQAILWLYARKA